MQYLKPRPCMMLGDLGCRVTPFCWLHASQQQLLHRLTACTLCAITTYDQLHGWMHAQSSYCRTLSSHHTY